MSAPTPFIGISNQQIYDKLVSVEGKVAELVPLAQMVAVDHERLRSVELELAGIKANRKLLVAAYTCAAALGGGALGAAAPLLIR